jgi:hyperosmotically inducible protein
MPRKSWAIVPAALGLALAVGTWAAAQEPKEPKDLPPTPPAQQPKGTGETIGEAVDSVLQGILRGARSTSETLQEQFQRARTTVHNMSAQARVYSRLHWDKALVDAKIDVEVREATAVLRGTVRSLRERAKAAELARDTVGIDRVDDQLTIEPASPAETPEPAEKSKN